MVTTLRAAGIPAREIAKAIPDSRFLLLDGTLAGAELREAFHPHLPERAIRGVGSWRAPSMTSDVRG
jgi:hypothetical protein